MARVSCWLPLLLVFYIVWQAYQSSKLKEEILVLKRENFRKETRHEAPLRGEISYYKRENVRITTETQERTSGRLMFCERLLYC